MDVGAGERAGRGGTTFLTGFPGFLACGLLPRLLSRPGVGTVVCLVEPRRAGAAGRWADALARGDPAARGRIRLVEGDIARPSLGLGPAPALRRELSEIFHLAALYDLAAPRGAALGVNVDGTRHVLQFADGCPGLERFHHVSTCYVSGRHRGIFLEEELDVGQRFHNGYEETKFLAEVQVRFWMEEGMPGTIYRPSIVVGDSDTGATQKYDGPYHVIRWLLRQPRLAVLPVVARSPGATVNLVPRDYVVDAMARLAGVPASLGKTYQLADPEPPTVREFLRVLGAATGRRVVRLPVPRAVLKGVLRRVAPVGKAVGIPPALVDYFDHPTRYDTRNARRGLEGTGIRPPPFAEYADRIVAYVRHHPQPESGVV